MPVEIKELVIRAVITQPAESTGSPTSRPHPSERVDAEPALDREAVVREAVREVLRILKAGKER